MATHGLTTSFQTFFGNLNPATTWATRAASQYSGIQSVLEGKGDLEPKLFLQGSYRRDTAIYTINDVDIVALCKLWFPGTGSGSGWNRDQVFAAVAAPLLQSATYARKVRYGPTSLCIKLDLDIPVEILPAVFKKDNYDAAIEPFFIYRPEVGKWVQAFARVHQEALTRKNASAGGNFIPAIKALKHLRRRWSVEAVSFHIECLLYSFVDVIFRGGPADYIAQILKAIALSGADKWWAQSIATPAGERLLFSDTEWTYATWISWHKAMSHLAPYAEEAMRTDNKDRAVQLWRWMLGEEIFPA